MSRARTVRRNGLDGCVRQRAPSGGHGQRQLESGLEVRLVEERKRRAGPIGDEQAVEEVRVAVQRRRPRDELDFDFVAPAGSGPPPG